MLAIRHQALHRLMNEFLESYERNGRTMRAVRGNNGRQVRARFTRQERLEAMAAFYRGPGAHFGAAARDFFRQHPGL